MKKRQSSLTAPRVPARHAARRMSRARESVAAAALLIFAMLGWGLADFGSDEPTVPPQNRPDAVEPVTAPLPVSSPVPVANNAATSPVEIQPAVSVTRAAPRENVAPSRPVVADQDPPPRPASRTFAGYVGTLTVDANPAGEVFVDRRSVGRTPIRLENLRAGSHLVWIERDGYRRWTRVVAVAANRVSRVSADLDPINR